MDTRTINLRDLPDELVRRAKACAALNGVTLRDYVVQAISSKVELDLAGATLGMVALTEPVRGKKGRAK